MFCIHCGNKLPDDAVFCNRCGQRQNVAADIRVPDNAILSSPSSPPSKEDAKRAWMYVLGGCIVLVMGALLYWGIAPKPSPALPELPEIPETPGVPHVYSDVSRYQCYAVAFWQGSSGLASLPSDQCAFLDASSSVTSISQVTFHPTLQPFHTLPIEYPFLTIALFTLGFITSQAGYQVAFALWMALVAGIIYFVLLQHRSVQAAVAFAIYLVLGSWATAEGRFDLAPAAFTLGAVILAGKARWKLAFSLLALATLLKFYPVVLVLPFLIAQQMQSKDEWISWQRWKAFGIFVGICAVVSIVSLALTVDGTLNPIRYFVNRPIQIESLPASLLWLGNFIGYPVDYIVSFQSFNFLSPLSLQIGLLSTLCLVGGLLYTGWLQWRGKVDIGIASLLTLLIVLTTGKVFSAQYLIWITPMVAYVGKCNWKWLLSWGSVCLLTTCIFPYMYADLDHVKAYYAVILVRNGMLLVILCTLLYHATRFQHYRRLSTSLKS
jgi:hypothetical protein